MPYSSPLAVIAVCFACSAAAQSPDIPNPLIDTTGYMRDTSEAIARRTTRRVSEDRFMEMAREKGTIILDTRSASKFKLMHVKGAKHLEFSEMTKQSLAKLIPSKETRILIYCNNNFENQRDAFPAKAPAAPLNIPTFITLHSYGYKNVYELGPLLDPNRSKIQFEGSLTGG